MYSTDFSGNSFHHPGTEGQQFSKMKQTGTHKKKEERFNPNGQLVWDKGELERPFVPRSNIHKHTVTAGESKNPKDHRKEKTGTSQKKKDHK